MKFCQPQSVFYERLKRLRQYRSDDVTVLCWVDADSPDSWDSVRQSYSAFNSQTHVPAVIRYVTSRPLKNIPADAERLADQIIYVAEDVSAMTLLELIDTPFGAFFSIKDFLLPRCVESLVAVLHSAHCDIALGSLNCWDSEQGDASAWMAHDPYQSFLSANCLQNEAVGFRPHSTQQKGGEEDSPACLIFRKHSLFLAKLGLSLEDFSRLQLTRRTLYDCANDTGLRLELVEEYLGVRVISNTNNTIDSELSVSQQYNNNVEQSESLESFLSTDLDFRIGEFYAHGSNFLNFSRHQERLIKPEELYTLVARRKSSNVCHIVASGPTAPQALEFIQLGHDFFTVNFGALLHVPSLFHFVELASYRPLQGLSRTALLMDQLLDAEHLTDCLIVFKNLWCGNLDPEFVEARYANRNWRCISDLLFPGLVALHQNGFAKEIIQTAFSREFNQEFLFQMYTTTLSMLQVAYFAGYSDIVFHGFDGGGGTFFQDPSDFKGLLNPLEAKHLIRLREEQHHEVGSPALTLMPEIANYLKEKDVSCYVGSADSQLSRILPVYVAR